MTFRLRPEDIAAIETVVNDFLAHGQRGAIIKNNISSVPHICMFLAVLRQIGCKIPDGSEARRSRARAEMEEIARLMATRRLARMAARSAQ